MLGQRNRLKAFPVCTIINVIICFIIFNFFANVEFLCRTRPLQHCRSCKKMVHFLSLNVVSASKSCDQAVLKTQALIFALYLMYIWLTWISILLFRRHNYTCIKLIRFYSHCLQLFFNLRYVLVENIWRKLRPKSLFDGSKSLYMHMTGVNYGLDGKKITDEICTSIIWVHVK